MNDTMTAYVTGAGPGIEKRTLPIPKPGPDQLLVRTRAVSLNNADLSPSGEEHIAGYEFSGEVVDTGSGGGAHHNVIGNRVAGTATGAFAE